MNRSDIETRANFDHIRYAQLWEDADVLIHALGTQQNATLVSVCSGGDNALAMLTLDPARVVAVDLSQAQIACLNIRISAYRTLTHAEFLELMGSRRSNRRGQLLDRVAGSLNDGEQRFWSGQRNDIIAHGLGDIGKFERYFRLFRKWLLPLAHSKSTIDDVFLSRPIEQRRQFVESRWENWRWNILLKFFFSNTVMGRLGRDPAFFEHVEGSLADHVARRIRHAAIDLDPAFNPYLHWILKGTHGKALPLAWREEHFETIRGRLDRIDARCGSLEGLLEDGIRADGFNLSDIFEYMDETVFAAVYGSILEASNPRARLVYWNMMVPRRVPPIHDGRVETLGNVEARGKATDKAFFYSDFVVEAVR